MLLRALEGGLELLASVPLMIEYEALLTRPEHLEAILDAVARVCTPVPLRFFLWRPRLKDPADEMGSGDRRQWRSRLAGHIRHAPLG